MTMLVVCVLHCVSNGLKAGEVDGRHIKHKYLFLKYNHKTTSTFKSFYQVKPMPLFCQQLFALLHGNKNVRDKYH